MKNNKSKKTNRKLLILIILALIIFLVLSLLIYLDYENKKELEEKHEKILSIIKKNYSQNIITINNTSLYKKEGNSYNKIGIVSKDTILNLENKKIKSYKDQYFKIENQEYYVKYDDIIPTDKQKEKDTYSYLKYGKKLITKNEFTLTKDNNVKYKFLESHEFDAIINEEKYYKVIYDSNIYELQKNDIKEEKDEEITGKTSKISVIYYEKIYNDASEKCSADACVKLSFFKENMKKLEDEGYASLTKEEYFNWKSKKANLPEKSVLILISGISDSLKSTTKLTLNEYSADDNFVNNNNQSSQDEEKPSMYKVINKTSQEFFKSIMDGKTITYVVSQGYASGQGIAVLNYHFFYDPSIGESCNESICEPVAKFREHLSYLKDEGFKTLTMEEFRAWMYGETELPKKSVLITVDDGAMGTSTHLPKILEEYKMNATLFLITAWWQRASYKTQYLEVQSHGYNLHETGSCGQAKALCLSKSDLVEDLKKSIELSDNNISIAYPFYKYNTTVIEAVKEAGFKLAFAGGGTKAYKTSNKYAIPRYEIFNTTSLDTIKRYVN